MFCAALLNSQPMGFYQPAQLVRDAREHGVEVRGPDVMLSGWDCTLESPPPRGEGAGGGRLPAPVRVSAVNREQHGGPHRPPPPAPPLKGEGRAVRLGLRQIVGLQEDEVLRLIAARDAGARSLEDLAVRAQLSRRTLELLAEADAFRSLGLGRREALWAVKALGPEVRAQVEAPLLAGLGLEEPAVSLPRMRLPAHVAEDYRTTSLSLRAHPCSFFRPLLSGLGAVTAAELRTMKDGARAAVGGLVLIRQRPGTAKGVVFVTLEDETGVANAVVWKDAFAAHRRTVMSASFLLIGGRLQRAGEVIHVVAERFTDLSGRLAEFKNAEGDELPPAPLTQRLQRSRDFH